MPQVLTTDMLKRISALTELLELTGVEYIIVDDPDVGHLKISVPNLKKTFLPYSGATSGLDLGVHDIQAGNTDEHMADATKHRLINDSGTLSTELFSAFKILAELELKIDKANIANNLTTTTEGYVLDARQGKILQDTKAPLASPAFTGSPKITYPAAFNLGHLGYVQDRKISNSGDAANAMTCLLHGCYVSDNATNTYTKTTGLKCYKIELSGTNGIVMYEGPTGGGTFTDASWVIVGTPYTPTEKALLATLNGAVGTAGSVLASIKAEAEDADFTPAAGVVANTIKGAIAEVKGNLSDESLRAITKDSEHDSAIDTIRKTTASLSAQVSSGDTTNYSATHKQGASEGTDVVVAKNGMARDVIFSGRSYFNRALVAWATALDGWTSDYDSIVSSRYRLTRAEDATAERSIADKLDVTKYYLIALMGNAASDTAGGKFEVLAGTGGAVKKTSTTLAATGLLRLGLILQPSDLTGTTPHLLMTHKGSGYTSFYEFFITEITATEYGQGLAPMMLKYAYVTTSADTLPMRVEVDNKNFIDPSTLTFGSYISASTGALVTDVAYAYTPYKRVRQGQIIVSGKTIGYAGGAQGMAFYDSALVFISGFAVTTAITVPVNAVYARFSVGIVDRLVFQGEYGATATAFIAHQHVSTDTPFLRSVPAIADQFRLDDALGMGVRTQNVSDAIVLNGDEGFTTGTALTNHYVYNLAVILVGGKTPSSSEITFRTDGFPVSIPTDTSDTEHLRGSMVTPTALVLYILKTRLADGTVGSLTTYLTANPITVWYALATPTITYSPLEPMRCYEGGSVNARPFHRGVYQSVGATITLPYAVTLTGIKIYEYPNGIETQVPSADLSIDGTGKIITISGAETDMVFEVAEADITAESTYPKIAYKVATQNVETRLVSLENASTTNTVVGYEAIIDVANGATTVLPAGGTFRWEVLTYGGAIGGAKIGTANGGATLTATGNLSVKIRRLT